MTTETSKPSTQNTRLMSLDALRGFDMFWIVGGDALARSLADPESLTLWGSIAVQFEHVSWAVDRGAIAGR